MTDDEAIRDLQRRWFQATINGDVAGITDLLTDDVVFLTPGKKPFGRQEFIDSFLAMRDHVVLDCRGEYTEIIVEGEFAYATAHLNVCVIPKHGGVAKRLAGNALSIFRRQSDGTWRLARDANLLSPEST